MLKPLRRATIFEKHSFVDSQIALEQQATFRSINRNDHEELEYMLPLLDHLEVFNAGHKPLDGFCVVAYKAKSKEDYERNFPRLIVDFLNRMKIRSLFILTEILIDWKDYIFENQIKRESFLNLAAYQTKEMGYLVEVRDLIEILPLFFFANPEYPHILLVPAEGEVPMSLILCKDGNFHILFDNKIQKSLEIAAKETDLIIGSFEVCQTIKNNSFD